MSGAPFVRRWTCRRTFAEIPVAGNPGVESWRVASAVRTDVRYGGRREVGLNLSTGCFGLVELSVPAPSL